MKRSLVEGGIKGEVRASGRVRALVEASLLSALNLWTEPWPVNSFCSPVGSAKGKTQGLRQAQDPGAIAMEI